jgi:hypothetical protein
VPFRGTKPMWVPRSGSKPNCGLPDIARSID